MRSPTSHHPSAPEPDDPLRGAKAVARSLRAAGNPRGELLELEIVAREAEELERARSAMRDLSARRASRAFDEPGSRCGHRTWTASGLVGSGGVFVGLDPPLATWPRMEGLGAASLQTMSAHDELLRAIEEAGARWPRLARFEIQLDGERLAALAGATRNRVTHLTSTTATAGLPIPPMPSLRALDTHYAEQVERLVTPALEHFKGHVDRLDGPSLARRAPHLRTLATDAVPTSWSWLAGFRDLEVFELRARYVRLGDLGVLAELPRLEAIAISADLAEIAPILPAARLARLRRIRIHGLPPRCAALAELPALEELDYAEDIHTKRAALDFLAELPRLRALHLRVPPRSFAPLHQLRELRRLEIHVPWGRLGGLAGLTQLEHLALGHPHSDVKARTFARLHLDALAGLRSLALVWNQGHLDLSGLTNLRTLSLSLGEAATSVLPPALEHLELTHSCEPAQLVGLDAHETLRSVAVRGPRWPAYARIAAAVPAIRVYANAAVHTRDPLLDLRAHDG